MRLHKSTQPIALLMPFMALAALITPACIGEGGNNPTGNQAQSAYNANGAGADSNAPTGIPFVAVAPRSYVAKVKNVLTGMPATDVEVNQVAASPAALKSLIAQWQSLPSYQPKILTFLGNAFQQSEVAATDFRRPGGEDRYQVRWYQPKQHAAAESPGELSRARSCTWMRPTNPSIRRCRPKPFHDDAAVGHLLRLPGCHELQRHGQDDQQQPQYLDGCFGRLSRPQTTPIGVR